MAASSILVDEPAVASATAEVDAESLGTGPQGKELRRERLQIGGAALAEIAAVKNADPAAGDYGLVVRTIPSATATPISAASLPLPTGAATAAKQDTGNTSLASIDGKVLTDAQLRAAAVPVDMTDEATRDLGKVDVAALDQYTPQDVDTGAPVVNALPVVLKKTGAGAPDFGTAADPVRVDPTGTTTQPVSGPLTDTQLRASAVPVDVTDDAVRDLGKVDVASLDQYTPVAGRLPVDGSGVTQPVSIAATVQVDVTDEAARDLGKVDIALLDQYAPESGRLPTQPAPLAEVSLVAELLNALNDTAVLALQGRPYVGISIYGALTPTMTVMVEFSTDNQTTWDERYFFNGDNFVGEDVFPHPAEDVRTYTVFANPADTHIRVRVSAFTSGSVTCTIRANDIVGGWVHHHQFPFVVPRVTLDALNDAVEVPSRTRQSVGYFVESGTLDGTLVIEGSPHAFGSVWSTALTFLHQGAWKSSIVLTNPNAAFNIALPTDPSFQRYRLRVSAYTSGAAVGNGIASNLLANTAMHMGCGVNGTAAPVFSHAVAGKDGSGNHRPAVATNATPGATDYGLVTREAGHVAHDAPDAGNPTKVGGKAAGSLPAAVAAADRVDGYYDREGRLVTRPWGAGDWTQLHAPAANTRATATKSAGAAGVRHVCTGLTVALAATATAPTAVNLQVRLRDGVSDTGTILWEATISLPATAGGLAGITRSGLNIKGTAATAMTLEFSAAGGANTVESVSMEGQDITEA